MSDYERHQQETERQEKRRAEAKARFDPWLPYLGLRNWGYGVPAAERVQRAMCDVQEYRLAMTSGSSPTTCRAWRSGWSPTPWPTRSLRRLAPGQDDATIRWVLARAPLPGAAVLHRLPFLPDRHLSGAAL